MMMMMHSNWAKISRFTAFLCTELLQFGNSYVKQHPTNLENISTKIFTRSKLNRGGDDFCRTSDGGSLLTHRSANKIEIITFLCDVGVISAQ